MKEILRFYHLLNLFENKEFCTKKELITAISQGESSVVSEETWHRFKKALYRNYGFKVNYHRCNDRYSLESEDKVDRYKLLQILQQFRMVKFLQPYLEDGFGEIQNVEFDNGLHLEHTKSMEVLRMAIAKKEQVTLLHKGYYKSDSSLVVLNPLYFKQFQNRWYLIAEDNETKDFKSFAMDRVQDVKYTGKPFTSRIKAAKQAYSMVVGMDLKGNGLQELIIEFDISQKPYLESLKLHHSQEVILESSSKYVIKLYVNPNYELQQQIQKYGNKAKVVKGDWICL